MVITEKLDSCATAIISLLSMLVLHRMRNAVEAGFRRERGCRNNVLLLRLLMDAVLRAGKQAVVTFPVRRGVIQGDIFSPQCFTLGLDQIFRLHDIAGQGIGGPSLGDVTASKLEYADDKRTRLS